MNPIEESHMHAFAYHVPSSGDLFASLLLSEW